VACTVQEMTLACAPSCGILATASLIGPVQIRDTGLSGVELVRALAVDDAAGVRLRGVSTKVGRVVKIKKSEENEMEQF